MQVQPKQNGLKQPQTKRSETTTALPFNFGLKPQPKTKIERDAKCALRFVSCCRISLHFDQKFADFHASVFSRMMHDGPTAAQGVRPGFLES
jgi:hypothetical protein